MIHALPRILLAGLIALAAQLIAGALIYAAGGWLLGRARGRGRAYRRWTATWTRAARTLARAVPWAAGSILGAFILGRQLAEPAGATAMWIRPAAFVLFGGLPGASCYLLLHAGWLERRGRIGPARRLVRLGGQLMFLGVLGLLILVWSDLLFLPAFRFAVVRDLVLPGVALAAGMVLCGTAAFIGALAGLSRKPRPSCYFATAFYAAGLLALVAAAGLAIGC